MARTSPGEPVIPVPKMAKSKQGCAARCRGRRFRLPFIAVVVAAAFAMAACNTVPTRVEPLPALPLAQASYLVNQNLDRITSTLRAVGPVDGYFTQPDGRRRNFHLDATLFYLAPDRTPHGGPYIRFDLRKLGATQILIGSNEARYWVYMKEGNEFQCGRHGEADEFSVEMPVDPARLVDALGLGRIPTGPVSQGRSACVQRIEGDFQQVLFVVHEEDSAARLDKEFWLDRHPPRLIGRVLMRDELGAIELESTLTDYRPLGSGGPWLPHLMVADWAKSGVHMRFRIRKWGLVDQVKPNSIQFATPDECESRSSYTQ